MNARRFRSDPLPATAFRAGDVSELTTNRLSVYLRCLDLLITEKVATVSSKSLAERFHLNSAQIRKDLANFGEFGIRGVGYSVASLREAIVRILGLDHEKPIVIVGAGNLGSALAAHHGFNHGGFRVVALFDKDPSKQGSQVREIPVLPIEALPATVAEQGVEVGVLAVPPTAAQDAYDRLCDAGISAVLNFSPARITLRPGIPIKSVDLKISLEALSFLLARKRAGKR